MEPDKIAKLKIGNKEVQAFSATRKRRLLKIVFVLAVLVSVVMGLSRAGLLTPATPVRIVSAAFVHPSQVITDFNASGYAVAQRKAAVASKATGRLVYLGVQEGSRVKEGDILARIDSEDVKADKAQVEAQLVQAKYELVRAETELDTSERNYRRFEELWGRKVVAQLDFENARDRYLKAKAAIDSAKAAIKSFEASLKRTAVLIEYTNIRAPFNGVVLTKDADVGEVVSAFGSAVTAKAAVVTMADLGSIMVQADVAESFLNRVKIGQPCEIMLDAIPETRFRGKVAVIVPTADRTRGTVMVKVQFDELDPRILPEMSAKVAFLARPLADGESRPFLAVHRDALTSRGEEQGLLRVESDRVEWAAVASPSFFGDYLVLDKPFQAGDRIVLKPSPTLKSGELVKEAEQK